MLLMVSFGLPLSVDDLNRLVVRLAALRSPAPGVAHRSPGWAVAGGRLAVAGLLIGTWLAVYFGIGGIGALLTGGTPAEPAAWLMIGAHTAWGCGLLAAAAGYARLTDPVAARCVPVRATVVPNRQNAGRGEPRPRSDRSEDHEQPHGPQDPSTAG